MLDYSVMQAILAAQPHILHYTIAHSILNICNVVRFSRANDFSLMLHYYKANPPKEPPFCSAKRSPIVFTAHAGCGWWPSANDFSLMLHYYKANSPKEPPFCSAKRSPTSAWTKTFGELLYNKIRDSKLYMKIVRNYFQIYTQKKRLTSPPSGNLWRISTTTKSMAHWFLIVAYCRLS